MKSPLLNAHRDSIKKSAQKHGATSVRLFGSFARGEETADSDIDLLVEMEPNRSLFDIIALKLDIEDLTGRKADVVTIRGVSPYLAEKISKEAIPL
jgi:uncharacterized protein